MATNNNSGRFQKGVSGNPKGRPKGSTRVEKVLTPLEAELGTLISVTENGQKKKVTKEEAVYKQLTNKAAAGDLRAAQLILTFKDKQARQTKDIKSAVDASADVTGATATPLTTEEAAKIYREALKNAKPTE